MSSKPLTVDGFILMQLGAAKARLKAIKAVRERRETVDEQSGIDVTIVALTSVFVGLEDVAQAEVGYWLKEWRSREKASMR